MIRDLAHELGPAGLPLKVRFTRTIQKLEPPKFIEETYDDGALVGRGRWTFEPLSENRTRVSFHCAVRSNALIMHLGILFGGEKGHNDVYQEILKALEKRAGAA